jgi:RimJ/RimL family protein N-acetyltransferase
MPIEIRQATQEDLDFVRANSIDKAAKNYGDMQIAGWAKTVLIDGDIIGVGGVVVYWQGCGEGWFQLSKQSLNHKIEIVRCIRNVIRQAFEELKLKHLQVTERPDFPQSIKMAESFGFKRVGLLRNYLPDGTDAFIYDMTGEDYGS